MTKPEGRKPPAAEMTAAKNTAGNNAGKLFSKKTPAPRAHPALRLLLFCLLPLALCLAAGCGYKLGRNAGTPFNTLDIAPIENETQAAQVQQILHQQLADSIQQESTVRVTDTAGQATLKVRITGYTHEVSATRPDDTVRGSTYLIRMTAKCTLTDNTTGKVYFKDRPITAAANATASGSFSASEYQTLPIITRELALRIKDSVVSTW